MSLFTPLPQKTLSYGSKTLSLAIPQVMGILNITPDSSSDGGQFCDVKTALGRACQMVEQGASIIDIGAESTRPNATAVSPEQELDRLIPIVKAVRQELPHVWISIDTSSPVVMEQMAGLGADIWNDVRGLQRHGAAPMAARLNLPVVIMHSRGEPDTMDDLAVYDDVITQVKNELDKLINTAIDAGVKSEHIILDIGMGFAKNYEHHVALMTHLGKFIGDYPLLFGVSRKRFLGEVLRGIDLARTQNHTPTDRDDIGVAAALFAVQQGASIIRTHHVAATVDALALWQALSG